MHPSRDRVPSAARGTSLWLAHVVSSVRSNMLPMNIRQVSGRTLSMGRLSQWRTYEGLLAGIPDKEMNRRRIGDLLDEAQSLAFAGCSAFLIQPVVKVRELQRRGEKVVEEKLPAIACLARFDSSALTASGEPYSSLVVAWFQEAFGLPTDSEILQQIADVDWDRHAVEWNW